jgi:hypothetical protein
MIHGNGKANEFVDYDAVDGVEGIACPIWWWRGI